VEVGLGDATHSALKVQVTEKTGGTPGVSIAEQWPEKEGEKCVKDEGRKSKSGTKEPREFKNEDLVFVPDLDANKESRYKTGGSEGVRKESQVPRPKIKPLAEQKKNSLGRGP